MQFTTVLINKLPEARRLNWAGGVTIDGNSHKLFEGKCFPCQLTIPDQNAMNNELHSGALAVAYMTDAPTALPGCLEALLKTSGTTVELPTAAPTVTVKEKTAEMIQMEKEVERSVKENKNPYKLGDIMVDATADDKSDSLGDQLASEGSMENFLPSRSAFTAADKEAADAMPALENAFEEPAKQPDPYSKPVAESLFTDTAQAAPAADTKQKRRSRKEG